MSKQFQLKELDRYNIGTFADIIYRNALLFPEREAYIYEDMRITFSQYNERVNKLIHALQKMGVKKGDTIGILSWNCLQFADLNGMVMKGGFIASPFNTRLTIEELDYIINYSETNTLFLGSEFVDMVNKLKPRIPKVKNYIVMEGTAAGMTAYNDLLANYSSEEPEIQIYEKDPMYIIYTSGTTGVPRGALYTQEAMMDDAKTFALNHGFQPDDKHLQITPLFHIAGNTWFRTVMIMAICNVIQKTFDPLSTLKIVQKEKITHMQIVPTQVVAILNTPDFEKYDVSSMKCWWYGGSPMPLEVLKKGLAAFGPTIGEGYGQSESGPAITHLAKEDHNILDKSEEEQKILISTGRPDLGVHVRIVNDQENDVAMGEIGEIIVKSKHIMLEYWHKPEDTKNTIVNGWLHTGDLGYYDAKGYIFIADRKKDMIISGGENIYPREIEEVLYKHPAILEAAVIGIPDQYWVEKVHAIVALKKGANATAEEIVTFCKKYIAGYKTPKSIEFVDSLPKNAAGKILKKELREKYWKDQTRKI